MKTACSHSWQLAWMSSVCVWEEFGGHRDDKLPRLYPPWLRRYHHGPGDTALLLMLPASLMASYPVMGTRVCIGGPEVLASSSSNVWKCAGNITPIPCSCWCGTLQLLNQPEATLLSGVSWRRNVCRRVSVTWSSRATIPETRWGRQHGAVFFSERGPLQMPAARGFAGLWSSPQPDWKGPSEDGGQQQARSVGAQPLACHPCCAERVFFSFSLFFPSPPLFFLSFQFSF